MGESVVTGTAFFAPRAARIFTTNDFEFSTRKESAASWLHALCIHRGYHEKNVSAAAKEGCVYVPLPTRRFFLRGYIYGFSYGAQIFNIIVAHLRRAYEFFHVPVITPFFHRAQFFEKNFRSTRLTARESNWTRIVGKVIVSIAVNRGNRAGQIEKLLGREISRI